MAAIVEVDEQGAIQLPPDLVAALGLHTRFSLDIQGATLVLRPVPAAPLRETATPQERADAVRQWAALERQVSPLLPEAVG